MRIAGIDPGLAGAVAVIAAAPFNRPRLIAVADIPVHGDKAKRRVDVAKLIAFLQTHLPDRAVVERAQAMPDQGASSGFIYGRAVGAIEACVAGLSIPWETIEASGWKKYHALIGRDKEDSRQRALMRFPDAAQFLARKLDHNRAEAILMAEFGASLPSVGYPRN